MKWFFLILLFVFSTQIVIAQEVVKWSATTSSENNKILIKAEIADGWHLYSQHIDENAGPVPTRFTFESSNDCVLIGRVKEPVAKSMYDENFEATLSFFEKSVVFEQDIEINQSSELKGVVTFMVCNETMCLPPVDKVFQIKLTK